MTCSVITPHCPDGCNYKRGESTVLESFLSCLIQGALRAGHKCFVIFATRRDWLQYMHGRGRPREAGQAGLATRTQASDLTYRLIRAAGNSRYDTDIHLMRYAYTERRRSLSADAKIEFIRNDYERDVQLRKGF